MKKILMLSLVLAGCTYDPKIAIKAMEDEGYTDVKVTDTSVWPETHGCSRGDGVAFDVTAKNIRDKEIKAVVCCGTNYKACTIRH